MSSVKNHHKSNASRRPREGSIASSNLLSWNAKASKRKQAWEYASRVLAKFPRVLRAEVKLKKSAVIARFVELPWGVGYGGKVDEVGS